MTFADTRAIEVVDRRSRPQDPEIGRHGTAQHVEGGQGIVLGGVSQRLAEVHGLAYILAVAAFLIGVLLGDGPIHRFLRRPRLVLVGRISYGIYLIHILCTNVAEKILACVGEGLVFNLLAYALTAALSIAVAYALYRLIEHPLIEFGRRWSNRVLDRGPVRLATVGAEEL